MSKFKVGDRVRRVGHSDWPWQFGEVGKEYTVLEMRGNSPVVIAGNSGADEHAFELISPILTIQAGKFYKTRDGRKVGPMKRASGCPNWPWAATNYHDYCRDDGSTYDGVKRELQNDLVAEWEEPAAVAVATAAFKVGDRVRRPGHLTGTVLGVNANDVRIDYGADWGEYIFTVPELELVEAAPTPTTIKVGDWVRTDNGEIGIVLHDDGSDCLQFKVGFVGEGDHGHWDWRSDLQLTVVPPGTTKVAPEPEPVAANDNYEVGDIVEIVKNDGFFRSEVSKGDLASVLNVDSDGEITLKVRFGDRHDSQWINPDERRGYIRPYRRAA